MSLQKRLNRVRQAFRPGELAAACALPENGFDEIAQRYEAVGKTERYFHFKDNGSNVLAVAHLDSVQTARHCSVSTVGDGSKIVFSPVLDDRLGVYIITSLLPRLGIKPDILLTTGEETGKSTADLFGRTWKADGDIKRKQYNWMFQFDRAGTDVVMYQYRNTESIKLLKEADFVDAIGSFSDIARLDDLGCIGFNFGCGYRDYHNYRAYAWLDDTFLMVAKFTKFFALHRHTAMPYERTKHYSSGTTYSHSYHGGSEYGHYHQGRYYNDKEWEVKKVEIELAQLMLEKQVEEYEVAIGNEKPDRFTEYGYWRKVKATDDKAAYEKWRSYHEYRAEIEPKEQPKPKPEKKPITDEGKLRIAQKMEDHYGKWESIEVVQHGYWVKRDNVSVYRAINWSKYKSREKKPKSDATLVREANKTQLEALFGPTGARRLEERKVIGTSTREFVSTFSKTCLCGHSNGVHYGGPHHMGCNTWQCNCRKFMAEDDPDIAFGGI